MARRAGNGRIETQVLGGIAVLAGQAGCIRSTSCWRSTTVSLGATDFWSQAHRAISACRECLALPPRGVAYSARTVGIVYALDAFASAANARACWTCHAGRPAVIGYIACLTEAIGAVVADRAVHSGSAALLAACIAADDGTVHIGRGDQLELGRIEASALGTLGFGTERTREFHECDVGVLGVDNLDGIQTHILEDDLLRHPASDLEVG